MLNGSLVAIAVGSIVGFDSFAVGSFVGEYGYGTYLHINYNVEKQVSCDIIFRLENKKKKNFQEIYLSYYYNLFHFRT